VLAARTLDALEKGYEEVLADAQTETLNPMPTPDAADGPQSRSFWIPVMCGAAILTIGNRRAAELRHFSETNRRRPQSRARAVVVSPMRSQCC
jgi:hypothetical protein